MVLWDRTELVEWNSMEKKQPCTVENTTEVVVAEARQEQEVAEAAARAADPRRYSPIPATVAVAVRAANLLYSPIPVGVAVTAVRVVNRRYSPIPGAVAVTALNRRYSPTPEAVALASANDANEHETR